MLIPKPFSGQNLPALITLSFLITVASTSLANPISDAQAGDGTAGVVASTTGGGHLLVGGSIDVSFSFSAKQKADGAANGHMRFSTELGGLPIEFHGEVICVAVDAPNGRAWVGGVITANDSEHPSFTAEIHEPGKDIWFRVLDSGEGEGTEADRSTFVGFEGGGGIITSEEYCDSAIWPDDNERTSPIISGNIQIRDH